MESERFRLVFTTYSNSYSQVFVSRVFMSRCIHETRIRHGYDADTTSIRVDTREYSVSISNYPKIDIKLPPTRRRSAVDSGSRAGIGRGPGLEETKCDSLLILC